ncbi:phosphatidate cytidylyltransferase [Streptomyces sp. DSM 42041]|uniref:Phosphatidate cytidylyltransferase n=1 Tax=Streptomyces hazeniae TaxID=3075538 RepID=A0ABU2NRZ4_9ACTN|nr:phosphatidate cytidylyltransferase [Streptomyces sp. DSM 42041]MDT0378767.1 phosphatidate cytidylyltransferase [Streptomyces sp. DSM 42041]
MNDSSWGAPSPGAGFSGPPGRAPAPAPPAGAPTPAAQGSAPVGDPAATRPMPVVGGPAADRPLPGEPGDPENGEDAVGGSSSRGAPGDGPGGTDGGQQPVEPAHSGMPGGPPPAKGKKRAGRDLRAAIGVGLGLGAVIIASLFFYKHLFVGVVVLAVAVGLWELTSRLSERKGVRAPLATLVAGGTGMVVAGYVWGAAGAWLGMALTALGVLLQRMTRSPQDYLRDVSAGIFAAFYVPFLATFVALMLAADDGSWRVLTFLVLTVVSDTGAYAVGWRFGKHKLAPRISPGKTREGLLGAVSFAMAAGALCMEFAVDGGAWWQGLILGFAVAVSATLGDLGESMIKRDLGIKDMGTLLPGHGGIMDRLDSLLPTAPVTWLLFVLFTGTA